MKLQPNEKIKVEEILKDLENYIQKRKGWTWRKKLPEGVKKGDFFCGRRKISLRLPEKSPLLIGSPDKGISFSLKQFFSMVYGCNTTPCLQKVLSGRRP